MKERSSYTKIKEVRMKASQHEEGCFNAIEGSAKKYQIRGMELAVVVLNQNYGDDIGMVRSVLSVQTTRVYVHAS
ncbi:hypothetical protein Tco_0389870, partial [Tanacetum coccineum]